MKCRVCPAEISKREEERNSGLCDNCFDDALRATARDIQKRLDRNRNN